MPKPRKDKIEEQLDEMPKITKNEVIQETDFYKAIKKYEGETPMGPLFLIIIAAMLVIAAVIYFVL